jgi:hypothetical protein
MWATAITASGSSSGAVRFVRSRRIRPTRGCDAAPDRDDDDPASVATLYAA